MNGLGTINFGDVAIKILSNSDAMTIAELHFNGGIAAAQHHHINEEANYIIEGVFESVHNGVVTSYKAGDIVHVAPNQEHSLKCVSKAGGRILTSWTPSRKDLMAKIAK